MRFLFSIAAIVLLLPSCPTYAQDRAAWMKPAKWGVMTHYLSDWIARSERMTGGKMTVEQWNNLIDHFDVETLAKQLESAGAGYYQITIGQNSGFYLSPNATYDRLVGTERGRTRSFGRW